MKVEYVGMFDEVVVADWVDANGQSQLARRGEAIEVDDEIGARLLQQEDVWRAPGNGAKRAKAPIVGVGDDADDGASAPAEE